MMKTLFFNLFAIVLACLCVGCGKDSGLRELDLSTDSIVTDTVICLKKTGEPKATLHLNWKYITDEQYANINKVLTETGLLPVGRADSLPCTPANMQHIINASVRQYAKDYLTTVRQILDQEPDNPQQLNWTYAVDTQLKRGKDDNIVLLATVELYEGGENAVTYTVARNIQRKTCRILKLNDIFTQEQISKLTDDIVSELKSMEGCFSLESLQEEGYFQGIEPYATENFILTDNTITFIYIPGEIAPAEKGEIKVIVKYAE